MYTIRATPPVLFEGCLLNLELHPGFLAVTSLLQPKAHAVLQVLGVYLTIGDIFGIISKILTNEKSYDTFLNNLYYLSFRTKFPDIKLCFGNKPPFYKK
jgi:hypothetical protein